MKSREVYNKKVSFDYSIEDQFEAGLVLTGPEIKAFRAGQASLNGSFVRPLFQGSLKAELWLLNSHFAGTQEPDRTRKLLAHRKEIDRLLGRIQEKGFSLVPIKMGFSHGKLKVTVGLARGKKNYEKREAIKNRDVDRQIRREFGH